MAKKKKPAKKTAKKPAPAKKKPAAAKKKPARKPAPFKKKAPKAKPTNKARPAARSAGAPSRIARSVVSPTTAINSICTINQPDGSTSLPVGSIDVEVTVNHDSDQVCCVKADIVQTVPSDPLEPTPTAIDLGRDGVDPTKWNGVVGSATTAGAWTVLAWPFISADRCTKDITVTDVATPPPPPPPPPLPPV